MPKFTEGTVMPKRKYIHEEDTILVEGESFVAEMVEEVDPSNTTYTEIDIKALTDSYNAIKHDVSTATSTLNDSATFNGMESVSEIVAEGISKINDFIDSTKKPSAFSKALAVIDPNNSWAGKWMGQAKENLDKEKLKEKTIDEITNQVITGINKQREDVISYMEAVVAIRDTLSVSRVKYEELLPSIQSALASVAEDTREALDLKSIITRITKSIIQLDTTVSTEINPLIASARIAIQEIDNQLPDIEYDLKYKGSLKVAQQSLSNLIGMAKTVKAMTESAGDVIRKDIHDTTIESIRMVGDVIMDTSRMKQIQKDQEAHLAKVQIEMDNTVKKINSNFQETQAIHQNYIEHKAAHSALLLEAQPTIKGSLPN